MPDRHDADTLHEFAPLIAGAAQSPEAVSSRVQVDLGAVTDPGKTRPNNEDYLTLRFGRWMETLGTNLSAGEIPERYAEVGYSLAVADGMGGALAGEVASSLAIIVGVNLALNHPKWTMLVTPDEIQENMERWRLRFRQIDYILTECARTDPSLAGMGTTLTIACSIGPHLILYYVGDSRAYLFRQGKLHRLTRDHTQAQALADLGHIAQEEVPQHRLRHVLTRAIGAGGGRVEAEMEYLFLNDGDRLLLCTDGLTDMVADEKIAEVLNRIGTSKEACQALVDLALEAGGKDNVTVVLGRYTIPLPQPPAAPGSGVGAA